MIKSTHIFFFVALMGFSLLTKGQNHKPSAPSSDSFYRLRSVTEQVISNRGNAVFCLIENLDIDKNVHQANNVLLRDWYSEGNHYSQLKFGFQKYQPYQNLKRSHSRKILTISIGRLTESNWYFPIDHLRHRMVWPLIAICLFLVFEQGRSGHLLKGPEWM